MTATEPTPAVMVAPALGPLHRGSNLVVRVGALRSSQELALIYHLVGAQQDRSGQLDTDLEIEDELEFRCPLDRKIGGIG